MRTVILELAADTSNGSYKPTQTLQTAIANFLARSDLNSQIPEFIQLAEARINRELETREQEKRSTATLQVGDEYIALPNDLREIRR
jgi:hypothetical protein